MASYQFTIRIQFFSKSFYVLFQNFVSLKIYKDFHVHTYIMCVFPYPPLVVWPLSSETPPLTQPHSLSVPSKTERDINLKKFNSHISEYIKILFINNLLILCFNIWHITPLPVSEDPCITFLFDQIVRLSKISSTL